MLSAQSVRQAIAYVLCGRLAQLIPDWNPERILSPSRRTGFELGVPRARLQPVRLGR
jgi:hypothetical protein